MRPGERFSTAHLASAQVDAAYGAVFGSALNTTALSPSFDADFASFSIGVLWLLRLVASPRRSERTAEHIASDGYDAVIFQYVVAGTAQGTGGGRAIDSRPGTVLVLDLTQPFVVDDEDARTVISVVVPRASVARMIADPAVLHGRSLDGPTCRLFADMVTAISGSADDLRPATGSSIEAVLLELITLMLAAEPKPAVPTPSAERSSQIVAKAKALIRAHVGARDLTPEWLAAKLSVSRSQLYALFREEGGVSQLIWQERVAAARAALSDPHDPRRVGEIAYAFGFISESHFTRAFGKTVGASPRAFRRSALEQNRVGTRVRSKDVSSERSSDRLGSPSRVARDARSAQV